MPSLLLSLLSAVLFAGCFAELEVPGGGPEVSSEAVLTALLVVHGTRSFVRVNAVPYPTALDGSAPIDVYISEPAANDFRRITPEAQGSGAAVAPGTLIVRDVLDAQGQIATITLMYKGPPGYNPALGDFWFGVTDPDGVPRVTEAGESLGRLEACYGCHRARESDGYLFGVPAAARGE